MLDDLTPLNLKDIAPPEWYAIDADDIDKNLKALVAKKNMMGRYQAGVRISAARWRWSIKTYATAQEAEQAAREKVKELKRIKHEKR